MQGGDDDDDDVVGGGGDEDDGKFPLGLLLLPLVMLFASDSSLQLVMLLIPF